MMDRAKYVDQKWIFPLKLIRRELCRLIFSFN